MADNKKTDKTSKETPPIGPEGGLLGIDAQPEKKAEKAEAKPLVPPYFDKSLVEHVWDAKDVTCNNFPKAKSPPPKKSLAQKIVGVLMPKTVNAFMARIGFVAAPILVIAGLVVAVANPALGIPLLVAAGLSLGGGLAATYHNKQMLAQDDNIIKWYDADYATRVGIDLTRSDTIPVVKTLERVSALQKQYPQVGCSPYGMYGGYGYGGYGRMGGYGGYGRLGAYPPLGIPGASYTSPPYITSQEVKEGAGLPIVQRPPQANDLVSIKVKNPDPGSLLHEVKRPDPPPLYSRGATERNSHGR